MDWRKTEANMTDLTIRTFDATRILPEEILRGLRGKMRELTAGDLNRPIVAVGFNSERFDGLNLALRLVALGYSQVYWYRGGREAWEVAEQPETDMAMQDW